MADTNAGNDENGRGAASAAVRRKPATGFPVVSLAEAADILKEAGKYGFDHSTQAFASYMGHSTTNSGAFRQRLAAFRDWKLSAGRGDRLTMTEIARLIAHPTDDGAERRALRTAFMNCPVFFKMFDESAKGKPLAASQLGNRAVLNLGVAPSSKDKFVHSFVDSAIAAGLAIQNDDGQIVLKQVVDGDVGDDELAEASADVPPADHWQQASTTPVRTQGAARPASPVVHQTWEIEGGLIVFEIRSDRPLPAKAFSTVGEVVASVELLAQSLQLRHPLGSAANGGEPEG